MVLSVVRDYSLPGGYRAIVVRPTDMEWKMFRYNDTTASLALSDIDHMNGVEEPQSIEGRACLCSSSSPCFLFQDLELQIVCPCAKGFDVAVFSLQLCACVWSGDCLHNLALSLCRWEAESCAFDLHLVNV